jgi:hypothetical protein
MYCLSRVVVITTTHQVPMYMGKYSNELKIILKKLQTKNPNIPIENMA